MRSYFVGTPNLANKDLFLKYIDDIWDEKYLTNNGKYVQLLEKEIADYLGVRNAIAVTNASAAFELLIQTILKNNPERDEIIVPSFIFASTPHSIVRHGFKPVFCDITENYVADPLDVASKITSKTAAIVVADLFGNVSDVESFEKLKDVGIPIIYDSAHGLGVLHEISQQYVGNFGDATFFSLHATKMINSGEGGIITTNNDELAERLRIRRNFGFKPGAGIQGELVEISSNYKMSEITAALGLSNFYSIQEIQEYHWIVFQWYKKFLPTSYKLREPNTYFSNYSYIVVESSSKVRDTLVNHLHKNGIYSRVYFQPIHTTKPYLNYRKTILPMTKELASKCFCLPTGSNMTEKDVKWICNVIKNFIKE